MMALSANNEPPQQFHSVDSDISDRSLSPSLSSSISSCSSTTTFTPISISPSREAVDPLDMLKIASPSSVPAPLLAPPPTPTRTSAAHITDSSKRPKLSLQTSCLPITFGKSSTSLSLGPSTTSTQSPTVRNTFKNAYDTNSPISPNKSIPLKKSATSKSPRRAILRSNKTTHHRAGVPYQLPKGLRSILRNSPISSSPLRGHPFSSPSSTLTGSSTSSNIASAGHMGRRVLFPIEKRVNYRYPLEEEIKTVRFTAKHSDISTSSSVASSTINSPSDTYSSDEGSDSYVFLSDGSTASDQEDNSSDSKTKIISTTTTTSVTTKSTRSARVIKQKNHRSSRQIRAAAIRDGLHVPDDGYDIPPTPVKEKGVKGPRQWQWTLGPIKDGYVQPTSPTNSSNASSVTPPPAPSPPPANYGPSSGITAKDLARLNNSVVSPNTALSISKGLNTHSGLDHLPGLECVTGLENQSKLH